LLHRGNGPLGHPRKGSQDVHEKQRVRRLDSFDHAAITPDAIEEAIRRSQRLRSEAMAAGLAAMGRAITRAAGVVWHAASGRRPLASAGRLKPVQRPCP